MSDTVTVTMTFQFRGTKEEAIEYLQQNLVAFGSEGVADFINGEERWAVEGEEVEIS